MKGDCQQPRMEVNSLTHNREEDQDIFITIDDLLRQGQDLLKGLRILGEYKYPLEVRRGSRKEVKDMDNVPKEKSRMLKAGKKTYFFDIKETKEGKPYLLITESWYKDDEGKKPDRNNIIVFPEQAKDFALVVAAMLDKITQE
jgi:hypothetical protein